MFVALSGLCGMYVCALRAAAARQPAAICDDAGVDRRPRWRLSVLASGDNWRGELVPLLVFGMTLVDRATIASWR